MQWIVLIAQIMKLLNKLPPNEAEIVSQAVHDLTQAIHDRDVALGLKALDEFAAAIKPLFGAQPTATEMAAAESSPSA